MKMKQKRLCIYPKDIVKITGKSERYARNLIQKIKEKLNKEEHQFITVEEFCAYAGFEINDKLISFFVKKRLILMKINPWLRRKKRKHIFLNVLKLLFHKKEQGS